MDRNLIIVVSMDMSMIEYYCNLNIFFIWMIYFNLCMENVYYILKECIL